MIGPFPRIESQEFRGMGTNLGILIVVTSEAEATRSVVDITIARSLYARYEKIFSRFDQESELSRINSALDQPVVASREMHTVADRALTYYQEHDGLYDPRILTVLEASGYARDFLKHDFTPKGTLDSFDVSCPLAEDLIIEGEALRFRKRMDFSGIVKGYVTDRVAEYLGAQGWKNFLVDSGGDMYASGTPHDSPAWHITVEGLSDESVVFALSDMAIATSGISRRKWRSQGKPFHHLIHPKHPEQFSFDINTVSVVAASTEQADVLAKMLFLQNDADRKAVVEKKQLAALFLYTDHHVWISPAAKPYCLTT